MDKARWMITGANGFLGYRVGEHAARRGEAFGVIRGPDRRVAEGVAPLLGSLDNPSMWSALLMMVRPTAVIHLAAMTKVADCEADPDKSLRENVEATRALASACHEANVRFVYASTDMVFDGEQGNYSEASEPRPTNIYGQHKRMAEVAVGEVCPDALVCRLPWMFGAPTPDYDGHFGGMIRQLLQGASVRLFEDEIRTPLGTDEVAEGLLDASLLDASALDGVTSGETSGPRLLHFAGPLSASRYEIGCWAADAIGASRDLIDRAQRSDWGTSAARPANASLVSNHPDCLPALAHRDIRADIVACAQRTKHEIEHPNPHDHSYTLKEDAGGGHAHDHDHGNPKR